MHIAKYAHIRVPFYVYDMRAVMLDRIEFYAVYGCFGPNIATFKLNASYQEIQKERRRLQGTSP